MILSLLMVSVCFAHELSSTCPPSIDGNFIDHITQGKDETWQTPLSEETLEEIRDVINTKGSLTEYRRTLTSKGVQCWYKMPKNSAKKLDFVILNYTP